MSTHPPVDGAALDHDPFDADFIACPFPTYERLRNEAPVVYVPHGKGFWFVSRHDLVKEVVTDVETFSSAVGSLSTVDISPELRAKLQEIAADLPREVPTLLTADPPLHTRNRRLVSRAFAPRAVKEHEGLIRRICRELISRWRTGDTVEFVHDFAIPLPVRVITHALGLGEGMVDDVKRWSDASLALIGGRLTEEQVLEAAKGSAELSRFILAEVARRREQPERTDILTTLVHARLTDVETEDLEAGVERQLSDAELISIVRQLLVAGNETTTNLLTQTMVRFAQEPAWWERLRAEPELIPAVVEENLRLATPSGVNQRRTTREVVLGGQRIPAGATVLVSYLSANHDPDAFPDPETFDPSRPNLAEHFAFGRGIHFCVGAALARLEARIALEELTAGLASYELARPDVWDWNDSFMLRQLRTLPLRVTRRPP